MSDKSLLEETRRRDGLYFGAEAEARAYDLLERTLPAEQWEELQGQGYFTIYDKVLSYSGLPWCSLECKPAYHVYPVPGCPLYDQFGYVVNLGRGGKEERARGWYPKPSFPLPWADRLLIAWLTLNSEPDRATFELEACIWLHLPCRGPYGRTLVDYGTYLQLYIGQD